MKLSYILILFLVIKSSTCFPQSHKALGDTLEVEQLNKSAYEIRLTDPVKTLVLAKEALLLARDREYRNGIAESHRILGIGYYHLGKNDKAISNYLIALSNFKAKKNLKGQAKVYNNIGNLYKDINYNKGLAYFNKPLQIAQKLDLPEITAACLLNIGIINYRKKDYQTALKNTEKSYSIFLKLDHPVGITLSLQNRGVIYKSLGQIETSEKLLLQANKRAKEADLETAIASINLTLVEIYINKKAFEKAYLFLEEGKLAAIKGKSLKLQSDLLRTSYELERSRKNYKQALIYLQKLYTQDSIELQNTVSKKFALFEEQSKFEAREKVNAIQLEKAKTNRVIFIAALVVSLLAVVLIIILTGNIKKKVKTNNQLKILNEEISQQKENLDKVNQNLEKIIDERTQDLKIKNRKLSEYSSHLSHQIRGPIATMKGLMILEKENLIEDHEFITEIGKCVNEVDDRIVNINEVLHNLSESGLIPRIVDKETDS